MLAIKNLTSALRRNPLTTGLLTLLTLALIGWSIYSENFTHTVGYCAIMILAAIIVEAAASPNPPTTPWPIKDVRREAIIIALVFVMQILVTSLRFLAFPDFQHTAPWIKIMLLVCMIAFIYPVFLIIYFFFIKKYKLRDVGIAFSKSIWVALPVIAVIGVAAWFIAPAKIQFVEFFNEHGVLQLLALGFLSAAIPEEVMRVLAQTRLAGYFNNKALAWFLTGLLWALIHFPNFYHQSHDAAGAFMSALGILPIGLLWGFMTDRLRSIWPSVLVHGTNLWGFQNL